VADAERPRVLAIDADGTMTDAFIVDGGGAFVVGKAQTTPDDESVGFMASAEDAVSGPIGGVVGGQALARELGIPNVLCTDIGGTSFDIALLTTAASRSRRRPTSPATCSTSRWSRSIRSAPAPARSCT
jgi:N-methylhydantoinase A/oxoprolinase/acetone carboxylase beta subunit